MIDSTCQLVTGRGQGKKRGFAQSHLGGTLEVITSRAKPLLFWEKSMSEFYYDWKWRAEHKEQRKIQHRKWHEDHKEEERIRKKIWRAEHPDYKKAWDASRYIRLKPKCERCGEKAEHRHHPDHSKPREVMHLCQSCHVKVHMEERDNERNR